MSNNSLGVLIRVSSRAKKPKSRWGCILKHFTKFWKKQALKFISLFSPLNFNVQNVAYHFYLVNIRACQNLHMCIFPYRVIILQETNSMSTYWIMIMTKSQELCFSGILEWLRTMYYNNVHVCWCLIDNDSRH